jgi:hypothetical protein
MRRNCAAYIEHVAGGLAVLVALSAGPAGCGGGASPVPTGPVRSGQWGGSEAGLSGQVAAAMLQVTASNAQLTIVCHLPTQLNQPLILDSTGRFVVTGTFQQCCTTRSGSTRFEGIVRNNVMTLTLIDVQSGQTIGVYTLRYGQAPPASNVGCPE